MGKEKEVIIKVFPENRKMYKATVNIDSTYDEEEQIDMWVDENLKNVSDWEWN